MQLTIATLSALFVASAAAAGKAVVKNGSGNTIYVWSVGAEISQKQTVEAGKSWSEDLHKDDTTGGIAIKVTAKDDGIFNGAPQQIFAYNLVDDKVWYDLSTVDGNPFEGTHVSVTNRRHPTIDWPQGTNPGKEFSQIKEGDASNDVVFWVGASDSSDSGSDSKDEQKPADPKDEQKPADSGDEPASDPKSDESTGSDAGDEAPAEPEADPEADPEASS